jgi:predicted Zn finger-like uncharacterized protein
LNIRCERCSTTYDLDESLLAPEGSPVQCTKCQHVFTAVPPRTAGRTLIGVPAAPAPHPVAPPRATASEPPTSSSRQGPAIYRPSPKAAASASGSGAAARTTRARRDTMGAFEARLKASARLRWLVPLVLLLILLVVGGAWMLLSRRVDPAAARRHSEAMALVALDDLESLEKASQTLEELGRGETGIDSLDADRALAQLLFATGLREENAAPARRLAAKAQERDRALTAQPPAAPEVLAALTAEIEALRGQVEPKQVSARALSERAYAALRQMSGEQRGSELAVARALAIHFASVGDREQALRFVRAAGGGAERDPWIQLAEGWLDAREDAKEARERAVTKLAALAASRPEVVRARFLLARTQAALGKREVAAATLDGLLAVNPRHHRASRLRGELVASVAPQPAPAPAPAPAMRPPLPRPAAPAAAAPPPMAAAPGAAAPAPGAGGPLPAPRTTAPGVPAAAQVPRAAPPAPAARPVAPVGALPAPATRPVAPVGALPAPATHPVAPVAAPPAPATHPVAPAATPPAPAPVAPPAEDG